MIILRRGSLSPAYRTLDFSTDCRCTSFWRGIWHDRKPNSNDRDNRLLLESIGKLSRRTEGLNHRYVASDYRSSGLAHSAPRRINHGRCVSCAKVDRLQPFISLVGDRLLRAIIFFSRRGDTFVTPLLAGRRDLPSASLRKRHVSRIHALPSKLRCGFQGAGQPFPLVESAREGVSTGTLRGLTHDGVPVSIKTKVIEVDPRLQNPRISGVAERPGKIAHGVLKAIQEDANAP
jgi:hypothetical protein